MNTRKAYRMSMIEFGIVLAEECREVTNNSFRIAKLAEDLSRWATKCHRINEAECNEQPIPAEWYQKAKRNTIKRIDAAIAPYGITATFNGDPRGAALQLYLPRTKRPGAASLSVPERM
jgi:hypothetical protein